MVEVNAMAKMKKCRILVAESKRPPASFNLTDAPYKSGLIARDKC